MRQETAGFISGDNAFRDRSLIEQNFNPEAYRNVSAWRWHSRLRVELSDHSTLSVTPYARYSDMEFLQHFLPGTPLEENGQTSFGVLTAWDWQQGSVNVIAGLDLEYADTFLEETQEVPSFGPFPTGTHYDYEVTSELAALYVQSEWQLNDRLTLAAGLRGEWIQYDYDNRFLTGNTQADGSDCGSSTCRFNRPADRTDRFTNVSPKLSLGYQINDQHRLYAAVSQGYRAPQTTELYRLQSNQSVADLDTVSLLNYEVGTKGTGLNRQRRWSYEAVLFYQRKDDFIFRDSERMNQDDGQSKSWGVELAGSYQFSRYLDVALNANYAQHQYSNDRVINGININGNDIDTAPRTFGSLQLGVNPTDGYRLEMEWVHVGSYYTDPENANKYVGHDVANLRAQMQVTANLSLQARVTNVFNARYAERADFDGFNNVDRFFPGEPRALFVGAEFVFD